MNIRQQNIHAADPFEPIRGPAEAYRGGFRDAFGSQRGNGISRQPCKTKRVAAGS